MSKEKDIKEIYVDSLIVLSHILDEYEEFKNGIQGLISFTQSTYDVIKNLNNIKSGKKTFLTNKWKKFYKKYQNVIDIICQYTSIRDFISSNFGFDGKLRNDSELDFFYNYFLEHKEQLETIQILLEQIQSLGITILQYNPNMDFTNTAYNMNTTCNKNFEISYLDNMEIIPTYQDDVILYKTIGSAYRITDFNKFFFDDKTIAVNSLLIEPDRLPKSTSRQYLYDEIMNLKKSRKEECDVIRSSVDLSVGIDDLKVQCDYINNVITRINNDEDKELLLKTLFEIKKYLIELYALSHNYDSNISQSSPNITIEKLQDEKDAYLARRRSSNNTKK